jgi:hypothetical protein
LLLNATFGFSSGSEGTQIFTHHTPPLPPIKVSTN